AAGWWRTYSSVKAASSPWRAWSSSWESERAVIVMGAGTPGVSVAHVAGAGQRSRPCRDPLPVTILAQAAPGAGAAGPLCGRRAEIPPIRRHSPGAHGLSSGMHETDGPDPAPRGSEGSARLLMLVGRSAPPHRLADELLRRWHAASGSPLPFAEWADPSTDALAGAFDAATDPDEVERAVVAFARARAGADHDIESVAADLVALVRLAWPSGHDVWHGAIDPVGLVARGLSAWATVHATAARSAGCIDPTTGLATADYLRERIRELHGQCDALAISPAATFA